MPDILLHNISQETLDAFEDQAEKHDRSVEQELVAILEQATPARRASREESIQAMQKWQEHWKKQGKIFSDSADLIREDRNR